MENVFACLPASVYCNREMISPYQQTGKNVYDVRRECKGDQLCYEGLAEIQSYLNREEVKSALGVNDEIEFQSCNMKINFRFLMAGDW
jgi:cathepsin A (carboxypeptidase C)